MTNTIDEATYNAKSAELKSDALKAEEEIEKLNDAQTPDADLGLKLYDGRRNSGGTVALVTQSRRNVRPKLRGRCTEGGRARKERVERRPQARRESGERKLWALLSPFSSLLLYFWPFYGQKSA
ncbi:MAG: hypothetical protein ACYC3X_05005 [Pirellulaceae bacterium]